MKIFMAILALALAGKTLAGGPYWTSHDYEWTKKSETPYLACITEGDYYYRGHVNISDVGTVGECMQICVDQAEWPCLSIEYNTDNGNCRLLSANTGFYRDNSSFHEPCNVDPEVTLFAQRQLKDCRPTLGWTEFGGSCYMAVGGSTGSPDNWAAVREACKGRITSSNFYPARRGESTLYLADIGSEEENNFIANDLLEGERGWIGASKTLGGSGSDFLWDNEDGTDFLLVSEGYTKWKRNPQQPSNTGGDEDCVEINRGSPGTGVWNDLPCRRKLRGVCEFIISG